MSDESIIDEAKDAVIGGGNVAYNSAKTYSSMQPDYTYEQTRLVSSQYSI